MPKKSIVLPIANIKHCKIHLHNFTQVASYESAICHRTDGSVSSYEKTLAATLLSAPPWLVAIFRYMETY